MVNLALRRFLGVLLVVLLNFNLAWSLTGELLPTELIIPQLCKVRFPSGEFCSGTIVGRRSVLLARHCGMFFKKDTDKPSRLKGEVRCMGEAGSFQFSKFTSLTAEYLTEEEVSPSKEVLGYVSDLSPNDASRYDLAIVQVDSDFSVSPLSVVAKDSPDLVEALRTPGNCRIFGVGLNPAGTLGLAHGVAAPTYTGLSGPYNPIELFGASGGTPHDSGGPLVCNLNGQETLVGIVSKGYSLASDPVLEHLQDHVNRTIFTYVGAPSNSAWLKAMLAEEKQMASY